MTTWKMCERKTKIIQAQINIKLFLQAFVLPQVYKVIVNLYFIFYLQLG